MSNFSRVMFCSLKFILLSYFVVSLSSAANAQMPDPPGPEIDIIKKDVGEWEVEIKAWDSPDGEPMVTKGTESTRMLGGYWSVSDFDGNMMGMDFKGHGSYGYDTKKKKYIGTWIDSLGPYMMHTEGNYDKETQTLSMIGDSPGPDGKTMFTYMMTTCYKDNGRIMTMHVKPKGAGDDQKMKLFVMTYKRKETK